MCPLAPRPTQKQAGAPGNSRHNLRPPATRGWLFSSDHGQGNHTASPPIFRGPRGAPSTRSHL